MQHTDIKSQLPIEQLLLLYKQSTAAFFATISVLLYIIYWLHDLVELKPLSIWVSAIVVLNIYLLIWIYFVKSTMKYTDIDQNRAKQFILIYQIQSLMHGFSWGMLPFLLIGISISDTGIDMTKEQLVDLTMSFMQADISTTQKYGARGWE